MPGPGDPDAQKERAFEVGMDEAWKANIKRTYDNYEELMISTHAQHQFELAAANAQHMKEMANVNAVTLQALQNGVQHAQALNHNREKHDDLAVDRTWNIDEQAFTVADILQSNTFKDAIAEAVAVAVQSVAASFTQAKS